MNNYISEFFDMPIAFHRSFVSFGGATGAILLSQMCYWSKRTKDKDGWFWKTSTEWTEETGLSIKEQATARARLVKCGAIDEKLIGVPAKLHFKVNFDAVYELIKLNFLAKKDGLYGKTSIAESAKLYSQNSNSSFAESAKLTNTEITTEITTDNTFITQSATASKKKKKVDNEIIANCEFVSTKYDIEPKLVKTWLAIFKAKKKILTHTLLTEIEEEAAKCNLSTKEAILMCISKQWATFKAIYYENTTNISSNNFKSNYGHSRRQESTLDIKTNANSPSHVEFREQKRQIQAQASIFNDQDLENLNNPF